MKRVLLSLCYVIPTLLVILLVYRVIFRIEYSVILATSVIVCTFPFMMWLCRCGQDEIKKQERMIVSTGNHSASDRRICITPLESPKTEVSSVKRTYSAATAAPRVKPLTEKRLFI